MLVACCRFVGESTCHLNHQRRVRFRGVRASSDSLRLAAQAAVRHAVAQPPDGCHAGLHVSLPRCKGGRGRGSSPLGWAGKGEYRAGLSESSSPSGGEFPALPAPPLGGVRRFSGGSTAASRLKAPPPLTAIPDKYTLSIPSLSFLQAAGRGVGVNTATPSRSFPVAVQVAVWPLRSHLPCMLCSCTFTLRSLAAYSPALRVCLAGGGEGCGVSTTIPSHLSPVAMQGGTHTGRMGGGLPGKESPGAAAAALCSLSRLTVKFPQPLACLAMSCVLAGILTLHALPHLPHLPLETVPLVGTASHAADPLTSVAPPLSHFANAVPSLALSIFIPSLPTAQLCVCALQVEGRGRGQHRRFPTPLPDGRAGTCGDGREPALPVSPTKESMGVGLASQGTSPPLLPSSLSLSALQSPSRFRLLQFYLLSLCLKEGGSTAAMAKQRHPYSNLPPPSLPPPTSQQPEASWRSERLW
ncbi:unnamed protein product [Closterium sp. NIES-65]|nr:unnamed protein product [Closterium sp. NIES-65]